MLMLNASLRVGRQRRFDELVDRDEFATRCANLLRDLGASGIESAIIVGDTEDCSAFSYLTGYVPWVGWAALILSMRRPPILLTTLSDRDLATAERQTWITDVRNATGSGLGAAAFACRLASEDSPAQFPLAFAGSEALTRSGIEREMAVALASHPQLMIDDLIERTARTKSDAELAVLRNAYRVASDAVAVAVEAFRKGKTRRQAAVEAEALAYGNGAHDVRLLATIDGQWLSPIEGDDTGLTGPFAILCAVEMDGYWAASAESSLTSSTAATLALGALRDAIVIGQSGEEVAEAGLRCLDPGQQDEASRYGLGGGIGRNLAMTPAIAPGIATRIQSGDVLWLRTICTTEDGLACASQMVVVDAFGASPL